MHLGLGAVLTPADTAVLVDVGAEGVLVDERRDHLHRLNPTAALVWQCLDGASTLAEICADLADVAEVPRAVVEADVTALATELLDAGLATTPGYVRPSFPDELLEPGHDCSAHDDDPVPPCGCDDADDPAWPESDRPDRPDRPDGVAVVAGAPHP